MDWETIGRPGHFGKKRDEIYRKLDETFGQGNWRIAWIWEREFISFLDACKKYEEAYLEDSYQREDMWKELISEAKNVYDLELRDIESGLDYSIQKGKATHIQDIAIRNVVEKRGWKFEGPKPIRVRSHNTKWGYLLSPGMVSFHEPDMICQPLSKFRPSWYLPRSVEDFYQSNKVLQSNEERYLDNNWTLHKGIIYTSNPLLLFLQH